MDFLRKDRIRVRLTVDGRDCGEFQKLSGAKAGADSKKVSPGAGLPQVAIGGQQTADDPAFEKLIDIEGTNARGGFANDIEVYRWLKGRRGRGAGTATAQPLDREFASLTTALDTWTGVIGDVEGSDSDTGDSSEASFKVTLSADAAIS